MEERKHLPDTKHYRDNQDTKSTTYDVKNRLHFGKRGRDSATDRQNKNEPNSNHNGLINETITFSFKQNKAENCAEVYV